MTVRMVRGCAAAAGGLVLAAPAWAASASALIREDDPYPAAGAGATVSSLGSFATNGIGGYTLQLNSSGGPDGTLSHFYGSTTFGPGANQRTEGTFGPHTQTSFEFRGGISDTGSIGYSAISNNSASGSTSDDGVWIDDNPVYVEGDPIAGVPGGSFFSFGSRPGMTHADKFWFSGGVATSPGGSSVNRFLQIGPSIVLRGGDSVGGGLPLLSTSSTIDFDVRVSAGGTNYILDAVVQSGSTNTDDVLVINGAAVMLGGSPVREQTAIPASVPGSQPGDIWDGLDYMGINDAGDYLFTGDLDMPGDSAVDYIAKNGAIIMREGNEVDAGVINGALEAAQMNENGDWAAVWDVDTADGNREVLIVNGVSVLLEGDLVDWNGDGVIDVNDNNGRLADFGGIDSLAIGGRDGSGAFDVFFTADIDFNGTSSTLDDLEGGFYLRIPEPGTALLLALGGLALRRRR